jgi:hypothetical protein
MTYICQEVKSNPITMEDINITSHNIIKGLIEGRSPNVSEVEVCSMVIDYTLTNLEVSSRELKQCLLDLRRGDKEEFEVLSAQLKTIAKQIDSLFEI